MHVQVYMWTRLPIMYMYMYQSGGCTQLHVNVGMNWSLAHQTEISGVQASTCTYTANYIKSVSDAYYTRILT